MIIILLIAVILAFLIGEVRDGFVLLAILVINAAIGFTQEYKTEKSLDRLNRLVPRRARVWRNLKLSEISRDHIVPGDIVNLEPGNTVPADGRLLTANDIRIDESTMTGESLVVHKSLHHSGGDDIVWMGTLVRNGTGQMVVTATGGQTRFGHLATTVVATEKDLSPLTNSLNHLSRRIAKIAGLVLVLMLSYGVLTGRELVDQFFFALALAASVVPEGLPATISVILALAANRLAAKNALVKRLGAVATLGTVTVICTDKTGTLTKNMMTVERVWQTAKTKTSDLATIAALANNAHLDRDPNDDIGDPMEIALARWATKHPDDYLETHAQTKRLRELPFIEDEKMMSVIVEKGDQRWLYAKGAPERLLEIAKLAPKDQVELEKNLLNWGSQGFRTLAFARRQLGRRDRIDDERHLLERNLQLIGAIAVVDPPRADVHQAVAAARGAGIRVLLLTGDDPRTAASLARRVGILRTGEQTVTTGTEMSQLDPAELRILLKKPAVFARITPEQKLQIIETLKAMNEVVAVTGDGVNDGPALKRADIGIAMGQSGTDVAREAADIILLDDHFATIVTAIAQGRLLFVNLKKTVWYVLSANADEICLVLLAVLLQLPLLPIQAIQILAIALGTDILPAFALAADPPERNLLADRPQPRNTELLNQAGYRRILVVGLVVGVGALLGFLLVMSEATTASDTFALYGRATMAAYATIVICQIVNTFESRSHLKSIFASQIGNNHLLIGSTVVALVALIAFVYVPPLQHALHGGALVTRDWLFATSWAVIFLGVEEFRKWLLRARGEA